MTLLGRTANGLFWMFRYIERADNMARLADAGLRISLTNIATESDEWQSLLVCAGLDVPYRDKYGDPEPDRIINFLISDRDNPSSVRSSMEMARTNGRMVRTALTRDLWEALNESYLVLKQRLERPVTQHQLPGVLEMVKRQTALIRGTFHGTMLRNEIFDFCNLGAFIERADNTARILDVKYWVLLPEHSSVGSSLDNFQWASILRSVSAQRSYAWEYDGDPRAVNIVDFLMLNRRMPRSLAFCYAGIQESLGFIDKGYGHIHDCSTTAQELNRRFLETSATAILAAGLHEFLEDFVAQNNRLASEIAKDFNFYP